MQAETSCTDTINIDPWNENQFTMIDNVTTQLSASLPVGKGPSPFYHKEILFSPFFNDLGGVKGYSAKLYGCWLKYFPDTERLYIRNSLHKARHGNNYGDFTLTQVNETLDMFSEALSMDVGAGEIKRLEVGCNLHVADPAAVFNSLLSHRGKDYQPMIDLGHRYGAKCERSHYNLKAYDKTYVVRKHEGKLVLKENILRWEKSIKNMQCLHQRREPIHIYHLRDLTQPDLVQLLCHDLVEAYDQSLKGPVIHFDEFSLRHRTGYARMSIPRIKDSIKRLNLDTYNLDRRLYKQIIKDSESGEAKNIGRQLKEKCRQLINS